MLLGLKLHKVKGSICDNHPTITTPGNGLLWQPATVDPALDLSGSVWIVHQIPLRLVAQGNVK